MKDKIPDNTFIQKYEVTTRHVITDFSKYEFESLVQFISTLTTF